MKIYRLSYKKLSLIILLVFSIINCRSQIICTMAGNGTQGYSGDGGFGPQAQMYNPFGMAVDSKGNLYFADVLNHCIRKVTPSGIITTVAGNGTQGYSGDGGLATACQMYKPYGLVFDGSDNMYIADCNNNCIRKVSTSGIITTIAGNGSAGYGGDGGPASQSILNSPRGIAIDAAGNIYISDCMNLRVRKINTSGFITTVAGDGNLGYSGDGGPALSAQLKCPYGLALDAANNLYISDIQSQTIRKVNNSGIITTVAGTGVIGFSGDGGPAISAQLNYPYGVFVNSVGEIYIPDTYNHRVRLVNTSGTISTFCGNGVASSIGDGNAPGFARVNNPAAITGKTSGELYISEIIGQKIRIISQSGCLTTGIEQNANSLSGINLFPTVSSGLFTIETGLEMTDAQVIVTDALGKKIHEQALTYGNNQMLIMDAAKGIYLYSILDKGMIKQKGKLIIE